ncbi:DUF4239 domain-containing protein [Nocardia huaxiensis]|uniref:DUF4239 domain-containing protein n=1 Tax=Nocardia huaxiensis TaxID=2755382 RepID=A0A7D6VFI9_9NOCA|nr:DUF4239 domain-containing protein [Nocardia huaxiensis]QLY28936.1 DUF4239 domain-containing protein [Nocardia huaxiensis]UFS97589.1 DUF4239 domain-containing protein [Nocardia huaxiensis]
MLSWIHDLPAWAGYLTVTGVAVALQCGGVLLLRPVVTKSFGAERAKDEMITVVLTVGGIFYGLLLGLIAVAGLESYDAAKSVVADESATLSTLYREVSAYPEPERSLLRQDLAAYTDNVITVAWPALRRGDEPTGGTALVTRFQEHLLAFQPRTEAESIVHAATIDQFADFDQQRRHRIGAAASSLPDVLWWAIVLGGAITLALLSFYDLTSRTVHLLLGGLLAFFLGTIIFLIAALDQPFRGDLGVTSEPYERVYHHVMHR